MQKDLAELPAIYHWWIGNVLGEQTYFLKTKIFFMPNSNRNRESIKGNDKEDRTGNTAKGDPGYKKLPDNPDPSGEVISTAGDSANGKYSRTKKRDEDIVNTEVRGGS
jgi:hypothetical protein